MKDRCLTLVLTGDPREFGTMLHKLAKRLDSPASPTSPRTSAEVIMSFGDTTNDHAVLTGNIESAYD